MGLFNKLLNGQSSQTAAFDVREAFASILLVTVAADGHISDDEANSFAGVTGRMRLYQGLSDQQYSQMTDKLIGLLRRGGPNLLLEKAIPVLPQELRATAFAIAADLIFADGHVEEDERALLEDLQQQLEIPEAEALKVVEVMMIKNRG